MALYTSMTQLIGNTPLLELNGVTASASLSCRLLAKLEFQNISGSVKVRPAAAMLAFAREQGLLTPGGTVIEPTSGSTGISLAALCAAQGYRCIIVMPENMSRERRALIHIYGGQLLLTPAQEGMAGAIARAQQLAADTPGSFLPSQFTNPANPGAHSATTGPEIWQDTDGQVDIFIAGAGTGGTLTGVGHYLRSRSSRVRIVAVEPAGSPVLSGGAPGSHGLQGIGAGFIPKVLDTALLDKVIPVTEAQARETVRLLAKTEGILAGISSGAALWAAMELGKRKENAGKTVVTLFPDSGERYLSTDLFDP